MQSTITVCNYPRWWRYRELLRNLVAKDLKLKYRGSALGFLWSLLNPLIMIAVYTVAFKYIMRVQLESYTVFLITGILPWNFFSMAVNASTRSVVDNGNLLKKVHFPREILPISSVFFTFIQFLFALVVFFPALYFLHAPLGWWLLAYPFALLLHIAFTMGVALLLSTATVFYRDVKHLTEVVLLILFWVTPIFYNIAMIPERLRWFFKLNPMTAYITAYQQIIYWGTWPTWRMWLSGFIWAIGTLGLGYWIFRRYKPRFAEEV